MKLDANDRTLRQVLNSFFFFIPRYQRPYSWSPENVDELWEDAIQDSSGDYFIGSMVVFPHSDDSVAVIDGQQRLTTLTMILCAIRDAAEEAGQQSLANGTHTFIERTDENDEHRFILKTESSYPYLQDEILTRGEAELDAHVGSEELAIQAAYARIKQYVDAVIEAVEIDSRLSKAKKPAAIQNALKEIRDKVLSLRLVLVEVGDRDDATTIFVTLNSRGKDLEPADLVKAQLLQLLPRKGNLDRPLEQWQGIIDKFDRSQAALTMTPFLLAVWRSRYETVTEKKLTRSVRKRIKKANAAQFLKDLVADAELYRQIHEPGYRKWDREQRQARDSLEFFMDFGIRQPMPLLLSLMREFHAKRITIKQLRRVLRAVEDYHFAYNILASKTSTGGMSMFYARRARDLLDAGSPNARATVLDGIVAELKTKRPSDAEFDEAFADVWFTDDVTANKKVAQYALRRLYLHHAPKSAVDFSSMTIEHLSPQKDALASAGRLGNLIYVTETLNGNLGIKTFAAKRRILKLVKDEWVPPEVISATTWDDSTIDSRTRAMAETGRKKVWTG